MARGCHLAQLLPRGYQRGRARSGGGVRGELFRREQQGDARGGAGGDGVAAGARGFISRRREIVPGADAGDGARRSGGGVTAAPAAAPAVAAGGRGSSRLSTHNTYSLNLRL